MNKHLSKKLNKLDHTIPIYSPRTTYKNIRQNDENLLADLTLNFDPFTINVLKNEFLIRNSEMNIKEFILVVKEHLLSWQVDIPNRQQKLIRCLTNLFEEIDLNGNNLLEWNEFTNYIIEKATVLNNIKSKSEEIKSYTKSQIRPIDSHKSHHKFSNLITKLIYLPNIDRLAMFEEGSSEVMFMNPDTGAMNHKNLKVHPKSLIVKMSTVKKEEGEIVIEKKENIIDQKTSLLDILYIPDKKYQVLLTSTNDGYVRGWRQSSNGWVLAAQPENDEEVIEHHFNNEIYCLAWDSQNEKLYCGQKDGTISIWNFKTDTEDYFKADRQTGHTDVIMDMIAMPKLQFLASASLDGKIILWETINNSKKRVYQEHTRGIVSLAFNESLILLFSAGFDHEVCVWNPYIDNLIYKITVHSSPLLGVKVIEGTSQIITLDSEGNVKLTDIKKFNQIQTFSVETSDEKHKFLPQSFTYIPKPLKLAFSGRTIQIFEYDKNYNPKDVDDYIAICCRFLPSQLAFYTPAGNKVKLWCALTGDIKKIFSDLTVGEITCFALDRHEKRMIIGDSQGYVKLFNVVNGAKIKALPKHNGAVMHALHGMQQKGDEDPEEFFITSGMDNKIHMTRDNEFGENELIRTLELKDVMMTSLNFSSKGKAIIVGTNNGITGFYESDTGKLNGSFSESIQYEEISGITLLTPVSLFCVTTTSLGNINFIAMPPLLYKYTKVYQIGNIDPTSANQQLAITDCVYCKKNQRLYISDDKGYIRCYDISIIIEKLMEVQKVQDSLHSKSYSTLPAFPDNMQINTIFIKKAHNEVIKSLSYVPGENLLQTTAFDKKVKIWDSESGELIDQFMQNYDKKDSRPIAFKRSGTEEIYDTNLEERIDAKAVKERLQKQRQEKMQANSQPGSKFELSSNRPSLQQITSEQQQQQQQQTQQQGDNNGKQQEQDLFALFSQQKSPEEEFNPFYYQEKIDKKQVENKMSNPEWKLHIDFQKYLDEFENKIESLTSEVNVLEEELKTKEDQTAYKVFKVNQQQHPQKLQSQQQQQIQLLQQKRQIRQDNIARQQQNMDRRVLNKQQQSQQNNNNIEKQQSQQSQNHQKNSLTLPTINTNAHNTIQNNMDNLSQSSSQLKLKSQDRKKHQPWNQLYRKELKGKLLYRSNQQISLSKEEAEAAYKLAAALTNYDEDDQKALKFLDVKIKKPTRKTGSRNNIYNKSVNF